MGRRIFITGATGLLGREILQEFLQKGYQIIALKREKSDISNFHGNIEWITGDLEYFDTYAEVFSKVDLVIHAAGKVGFHPHRGRQIIHFNTNTTKDIVNACLEHRCELIFVSSVAALGQSKNGFTSEQDDFDLNALHNDYDYSKYFSEMEVWRGIAEGLKAIMINPSIILGIPARWHESSGTFWKQIRGGFSYYPQGSTGFVDARDVAFATRKLYENQSFGERFIINSENRSYEDFLKSIHQSFGRNSNMKAVPKWISSIAWRLSSIGRLVGLKPVYSKALHKTINSHQAFSNQKIKETIDIKFRKLEESVNWVSEQYLADEQ